MRAFADALDCVPMALAQNSGLSPIETLASIKSRQVMEKNTRLGVDCMQTGSSGTFAFSSLLPTFHSFPHITIKNSCSRLALLCRAIAAWRLQLLQLPGSCSDGASILLSASSTAPTLRSSRHKLLGHFETPCGLRIPKLT